MRYKIKTSEGAAFKPFETKRVKLDVPITVKLDFNGFIFPEMQALESGFLCNALPVENGEQYAIVTNTSGKKNLLTGGTVIGTVFIF